MFGPLANLVTGLIAMLIGALVTIQHVSPDLMVTLGLILFIGGIVQLLVQRVNLS